MANRKPNWKVWANVPDVRVWEAVALSLDIDPKKVKVRESAWMGGGTHFPHDEGPAFEDRIEVLRRNLGESNGLPLESIIMGQPDRCQINVANFAAWAARLDWDMPAELKALASQPSSPQLPPIEKIVARSQNDDLATVNRKPTVPEKLTLAWLYEFVPVSWWWWLGTVIVAAFLGGLSLGQSEGWSRLTGRQSNVTPSVAPDASKAASEASPAARSLKSTGEPRK